MDKYQRKLMNIINYIIIILIFIFVAILTLFIKLVFVQKEKSEENKIRVSLLQKCMIAYGIKEIPDLKDEEFNSSQVIYNSILSISTIQLNGNKGETIQIFNQSKSIELEANEIICLSYKIGENEYVEKVDNGIFTIPSKLETKVRETKFKFILYFPYDPKIIKKYEDEYIKKEKTLSLKTALALYNNNRQLIELRLDGIFNSILGFTKESIETRNKEVTSKLVSVVCVSTIKFLTKSFNYILIDSFENFDCNDLGVFASNDIKKLVIIQKLLNQQ